MTTKMSKEQWIALNEEAGIERSVAQHWHRVFEHRFPEAHQSFLEWLNVPQPEIAEIRNKARA